MSTAVPSCAASGSASPTFTICFTLRNLTPALAAKISKKTEEADAGYKGLLELRALHQEMDNTVLAAYGWDRPRTVGHDFYELEYLAENDRVRYTIQPRRTQGSPSPPPYP